MKKKQNLFLTIFLFIPALTVAQTPPSANTAAISQAQQLRRYEQQMRSVEKKLGEDTLNVYMEKGISPATEQALIGYFTQHYKLAAMGIDIYRLPGANNLYFVSGTVHKDQQSADSETLNTFLVLREQGGTVGQVSKSENDSAGSEKQIDFFLGQNKLLIIVSHTTTGLYAGNYAYEYANDNLKSLGEIYVIEKVGMSGSVWLTRSPMGRATAEYKNDTYYVTVRGAKGNLYGGVNDANDYPKKLAPPRSPVTFFYDRKEWRQVATR